MSLTCFISAPSKRKINMPKDNGKAKDSKDNVITKVNIDGTEYDLDQLSDKAKNIVGFVQKLDKEVAELRFQLDKAILARKQVIIDLQEEIK